MIQTQPIKAIETNYKGYRFRSRLEARWSLFLDTLGVDWVYEDEGYILPDGTLYLPDFWFPGWGCFAEVKPKQFTQTEYNKAASLLDPCILLDTATPKIERGYFVTKMDWSSYENYLSGDNYGRILLSQSQRKERLWFLLGEQPADYYLDPAPEQAARYARFGRIA